MEEEEEEEERRGEEEVKRRAGNLTWYLILLRPPKPILFSFILAVDVERDQKKSQGFPLPSPSSSSTATGGKQQEEECSREETFASANPPFSVSSVKSNGQVWNFISSRRSRRRRLNSFT